SFADSILTLGPLVINRSAFRAWLHGKPMTLPPREWRILECLLLNKDKVVTKKQLARAACKFHGKVSDAAVDVYMTRLRSKLSPSEVRMATIRGLGYRVLGPG